MRVSLDELLATRKTMMGSRESFREPLEWSDVWIEKDCTLDVTVVIPMNASVFLAEHTYKQAHEVLLLCNGDCVVPESHAQICMLPWKGHAETRKEALKKITTKYTFFSVQDAFPMGNMLLSLIEEMESGNWDILMPRQIPWPDCHPIDRARIQQWTPERTHVFSMPHADHVGALYRSEDLRQWSLASVSIAEDVWWSIGRRVGCVPWARIIHSHPFSGRALFQRERAIHAQLHALGLIEKPSWISVVAAFFAGKGQRRRSLAESMGQLMGWMQR